MTVIPSHFLQLRFRLYILEFGNLLVYDNKKAVNIWSIWVTYDVKTK